jgi:hypothetical protein
MEPLPVLLQFTPFTTPVTVIILTVTTWSAAPARMQASPPIILLKKVFTNKGPIAEPERFCPV